MTTEKHVESIAEPVDYFKLDDLRFDPLNPRLPSNIHGDDDKEVIEWMLDDATIIELMRSIGENGYFDAEPLLIVREQGEQNIYQVVEGNRRLAAVMLLNNPNLAPIRKQAVAEASTEAKVRPQLLPGAVYPNRESILNYLGYRHITGIKPWHPLAKAKYLEQLRKTLSERNQERQFQSLARTIGTNSAYVGRLLTGLALYEEIEQHDFFRLKGVDEQSINFSLITTALQYSNIVRYLGLTSNNDPSLKKLVADHLRELTSWIFAKGPENTTRLGESRNLRKLNAVVSNKAALSTFRNGASLDDAALLTGVPTEVFRLAIAKAKGQLQNARDYIHKVKDATEADAETLADIEDLAQFLYKNIKAMVTKQPKRKNASE